MLSWQVDNLNNHLIKSFILDESVIIVTKSGIRESIEKLIITLFSLLSNLKVSLKTVLSSFIISSINLQIFS